MLSQHQSGHVVPAQKTQQTHRSSNGACCVAPTTHTRDLRAPRRLRQRTLAGPSVGLLRCVRNVTVAVHPVDDNFPCSVDYRIAARFDVVSSVAYADLAEALGDRGAPLLARLDLVPCRKRALCFVPVAESPYTFVGVTEIATSQLHRVSTRPLRIEPVSA